MFDQVFDIEDLCGAFEGCLQEGEGFFEAGVFDVEEEIACRSYGSDVYAFSVLSQHRQKRCKARIGVQVDRALGADIDLSVIG